ncbi:hypothetical protein Patl1_11652 [Pistacia atlantica]|uniref:Uncharacterized protein n=1 Tax=Pistacia atlantica TaxID=434234 RepID=A0ACC1A9M7_9ROSI|nr:hypothetical protein Patl1_11652 [Pistacia atlantica]
MVGALQDVRSNLTQSCEFFFIKFWRIWMHIFIIRVNIGLLFSKFLFRWKQRHWICCLVTHSLILF